jgi:hypothetical protein
MQRPFDWNTYKIKMLKMFLETVLLTDPWSACTGFWTYSDLNATRYVCMSRRKLFLFDSLETETNKNSFGFGVCVVSIVKLSRLNKKTLQQCCSVCGLPTAADPRRIEVKEILFQSITENGIEFLLNLKVRLHYSVLYYVLFYSAFAVFLFYLV